MCKKLEKLLYIRVSESVYNKIKKEAEIMDCNMSDIARKALKMWVINNE